MCLLLPVNSVFIIKDNIIPKELRQDRKCKGGLVLSKFKPDKYVNMSCANIRFQQYDKQDFVFRDFRGPKNEATTSPTEYLAEYVDGVCKMKVVELQDTYQDIEYNKIHSVDNIPSLLNSYGYCKEEEEFKRINRDVPVIVNNKSCEFYGFRSSYTDNECSVYSGTTITHDDKIFFLDKPWGCVKNDGEAWLNVFAEDDVPLGAENNSYSDRNEMYYNLTLEKVPKLKELLSSFERIHGEMLYVYKSIDLGLNEYARPTQSPQLLKKQHKYTEFINSLPPKYMPYPTGREDDWRIEYNEIYFTPKFGSHYRNLTSKWGAEYHIQELDYRIHLQLIKDTLQYIGVLKNADVRMRGLFEELKIFLRDIEDEYISLNHIQDWLVHMQLDSIAGSLIALKDRVETAKLNMFEVQDITLSTSVRIKEILDDMDFEYMRSRLQVEKEAARDTLYEAYVELSNERYKPIDLDKRALHYPDEVRIIFGRVINGVVQIPSDYQSDPRYIRYENALNSNWKDTYVLKNVRLFENPINYRYLGDSNGVIVVDFDTVADNAVRKYEEFYTEVDTSFVVIPLQEYKYVRSQGLMFFNPKPVGVPEVTDDRYESRLNIQNQMVNLEHQMILNGDRNLTKLLSLHRQFISQPPLCTDEYKCQCYETKLNKGEAVRECGQDCPKAFRHFWDQSEPRLTSKILIHDRSECVCMGAALTELECVLQGRQWINELFVSQYDMVPPTDSIRRDTQYEDTYLYCKMMDCVNGVVDEPCLYSGGVCESGWFDGNCNDVNACDGFVYEACICGSSPCARGKYCTNTGVCRNIVPKDDKKLLHLYDISII